MGNYKQWDQCPVDISDNDIFAAMKKIDGYIDITPADFRIIYQIAYQQAVARLYQNFKAADVMTQPVISVQQDTSLLETSGIMARHNISGVPVIDKNQCLVGVVSEKDFLRELNQEDCRTFMGVIAQCLKNKGCLAIPLQNRQVRDIMSAPPVFVTPDTALTRVTENLERNNINRLPVIDQDYTVIGIITRSDIIQHFCALPES